MQNYRSLSLAKQIKYSLLLHLVVATTVLQLFVYSNWNARDNWTVDPNSSHNHVVGHDTFTSHVKH